MSYTVHHAFVGAIADGGMFAAVLAICRGRSTLLYSVLPKPVPTGGEFKARELVIPERLAASFRESEITKARRDENTRETKKECSSA